MQKISVSIEIIGSDAVKVIDGIKFTSCAFVKLEINELELLAVQSFEGSVVFFPELERSLSGSGKYLIFTCACGIAEDAGWSEIEVGHRTDVIYWEFERETLYRFEFDAEQYLLEIRNCCNSLKTLDHTIKLEPANVVFPIPLGPGQPSP